MEDWIGKNLPGAESGLFIPTDVKNQILVDCLQFSEIVGIDNVDAFSGIGHIPGDASIVEWETNLFDLGADKKKGVYLVSRSVNYIYGDRMGAEEIQYAIL
jgi:hypothetical protein